MLVAARPRRPSTPASRELDTGASEDRCIGAFSTEQRRMPIHSEPATVGRSTHLRNPAETGGRWVRRLQLLMGGSLVPPAADTTRPWGGRAFPFRERPWGSSWMLP